MPYSPRSGSVRSSRGPSSFGSARELSAFGSDREPSSVESVRSVHSADGNIPAYTGPSAELCAPAWLEPLGKKVDNPLIDLPNKTNKKAVYQNQVPENYLFIKNSFYQALVSDKKAPGNKKLLIDEVLKRLEKESVQDQAPNDDKKHFNQSLLPDVLRQVDNNGLLQYAYKRVECKLDELASQEGGCLYRYKKIDREDKAPNRETACKTAFYRAVERGLSDIRDARVNSILSVRDDQERLTKLTRHLLDKSFISPTLQHQEDIKKVLLSFRSESVKAKAFEVFAKVVSEELKDMRQAELGNMHEAAMHKKRRAAIRNATPEDTDRALRTGTDLAELADIHNEEPAEMHIAEPEEIAQRAANLAIRKAYISHLAGAMTTFKSLKPGTPGGKAIGLLDHAVDPPENMTEIEKYRTFPLENRNLGTDALAGHLPHMPTKLRQEVLHHIKVRMKEQESLDKSPEFKKDQVAKMIMASVLGYPPQPGEYPPVERSNYARIPNKKIRQDLVKLVYQNRHALSAQNKADLMKVFRHFKDEVSSEGEQKRWSSLRVFTRGGRTVNRMRKINDESVPML